MSQDGHCESSARTELTDQCLDNQLRKKHKPNWKIIIQHRPNASADNEKVDQRFKSNKKDEPAACFDS